MRPKKNTDLTGRRSSHIIATVRFAKYHAARNDFVVVVDEPMDEARARHLCDRRTGVGADGVLQVTLSRPPEMRVFNADGSVAEMCGNGLRCVVKHLVDRRLIPSIDPATGGELLVATGAGLLAARWEADPQDKVSRVRVDLGAPRSPVTSRSVVLGARVFAGHTTSMGNPHFVLASADPSQDANTFGHDLATHPDFAEGANVAFARFTRGARRVQAVIFERGAGLTPACGTGASALVIVGRALGLLPDGAIDVQLPGGTLTIEVLKDGHVAMTGPVTHVFDGVLTSWQ